MTTYAKHWRIHENKHITYTLIGVSLLLIIFSITVHFYQHFKCQKCCPAPPRPMVALPHQRSSSVIKSALKYKNLQCLCGTADGENFDFFPMAFLFYLIFLVFVCFILILKMLLIHTNNNHLIADYNVKYPSINLHNIGTNYYGNNYENLSHFLIKSIDITVIYLIMIISLIESLFTFYRFYTTLMTTKHLLLITIQYVLKKFACYTLLFVTLYATTIHLYFWMFPFVILIHCVFNIYCNWRFTSILIMTYSTFFNSNRNSSRISVEALDDANREVLQSAYFMRKVSLIATFIQILYLTIFMCIYYVNMNLIIFYLPILWSISSFIFTLNFVRNRLFVQYPFNKISKKLKDCCAKTPTTNIPTVAASGSALEMPPTVGSNMDSFVFVDGSDGMDGVKRTSADLVHLRKASFDSQQVSVELEAKPAAFELKIQPHDLRITNPQQSADIPGLNAVDSNNTPLPNECDTRMSSKSLELETSAKAVNSPTKSKTSILKSEQMDSADKPVSFKDYGSNSTLLSPDVQSNGSNKAVPLREYGAGSNCSSPTRRFFGAVHHETGPSVEYTQHSRFDMSVQTEVDVDGKKKEEYDRHLANQNRLHNDGSNSVAAAPHFRHLPSFLNDIDVGTQDIDIIKEEDMEQKEIVKKRLSEHEHKLDTFKLTLQLTLLRKFGFDVRDIKKSFST